MNDLFRISSFFPMFHDLLQYSVKKQNQFWLRVHLDWLIFALMQNRCK